MKEATTEELLEQIELLRTEKDSLEKMIHLGIGFQDLVDDTRYGAGMTKFPTYQELQAEIEKLHSALKGIVEIGKRDLSNPKYDGYFEEARQVLGIAITAKTQTTEIENRNVMVKVDGKNFRCACGGNVFGKFRGVERYQCNSCDAEYTST